MARRVQINVSYEDALILETLVADSANEFYETHDMNNRENLEAWAKLDRIKADIAIAIAYSENL